MIWRDLFENVLFGDPIEEVPSQPCNTWDVDYAIWRLWRAKKTSPCALLDHAVLVRQCLRWMSPHRIRGDRLKSTEKSYLESVGIHLSLSGYLEVEAYRPDWLGEGDFGNELDALPHLACIDESFPSEDWLMKVTGKSKWRSQAQKESCWKALTSLPGSTNLIGLPTGAGKSLVFQVAAAFSNGLMVVIVPTVSLGLDQLANAKLLPTATELNPAIYSSGDDSDTVRAAVENRHCRLLFTSPEACVSGRLRSVLDQCACDGWLQWVVVDEAHIVESWGADFRIEFQLLGALVREWRQRSSHQLRALLLSATFAESTREVLRGLFIDPEQSWSDSVSQRLRPEIHYHIQYAESVTQKNEWVEDAIMHMPRPLILYVTEREEAVTWYFKAKSLGFSRVECFHGDTKQAERRRIMESWRSDCVDIMVATSAFGMGVDKDDVRSIIHACFPESIDRFYQEVGRGGRDGASTQSVMIFTEKDKQVAKRLAPTLLKSETVNDRWLALWASRQEVDSEAGEFRVRCDSRRKQFLGKRTYQENIRWNKRLLQMLHRAKLLRITGLISEKVDGVFDEYIEWVSIKNIQFPSVDTHVGDRLTLDREKELSVIREGFIALEKCVQGEPVCCELQKYYGRHVVRACGSCSACRGGGDKKRGCGPLQWPQDSSPTDPRVNVVPMARVHVPKGRAEWILAIRKSINQGTSIRFVVTKEDFYLAESLLSEAVKTSVSTKYYRLDLFDGEYLPFVGTDERIVSLHPVVFRAELDSFNRFGQMCSHWMPREQIEDIYGRSRFTQDHSARLFDGVETWLFENRPLFVH